MSNPYLIILNTQPILPFQTASWLIFETLKHFYSKTTPILISPENPLADLSKITYLPLDEYPPKTLTQLTDYVPQQAGGWFWTTSHPENIKYLKQAKRVLSFPTVVTHHDRSVAETTGPASKLKHWLLPWHQKTSLSLDPTDFLVTTSLIEAENQRTPGTPQVKTIPWGIDPSKFRFKRSYQPPFDLLATDPEENSFRLQLFNALSLLPHPKIRRVTIIANKNNHDELRKMSLSLGVSGRVKMVSVTDDSDLPKLFSTADLYLHLLPESARNVTFLAAQAAGLPVLATSSQFVQEYQPKRNHMLNLTQADSQKIAKRALLLLDDAEIRLTAVKRALAFTRKYFTWPQIARYYQEIFIPSPESGLAP